MMHQWSLGTDATPVRLSRGSPLARELRTNAPHQIGGEQDRRKSAATVVRSLEGGPLPQRPRARCLAMRPPRSREPRYRRRAAPAGVSICVPSFQCFPSAGNSPNDFEKNGGM